MNPQVTSSQTKKVRWYIGDSDEPFDTSGSNISATKYTQLPPMRKSKPVQPQKNVWAYLAKILE